ncbi:MAG: hypothetical protein M1405_00540 [Patescibacteria group bacterium]|nr:hypothetical protein [Patescibacteria group bacterium]
MRVSFQQVMALLRIALGFILLWAFFDKLFGLGFATPLEKSWLAGASPTYGFLKFGATGMFGQYFQSLAGNQFIDLLFMSGLLLIGLSLLLGIGIRIATYSGSLLFLLMWLALVPSKNNPLLDEHIIYVLVLWAVYKSDAGSVFGFGKKWKQIKFVKDNPILQ